MEGNADDASTEPGSSEAASDGADASLPADETSDGEPPACSQAATGTGACAAEEGPTCGDKTERRMLQIEEGDGNGERGVDFAVTSAAVGDADVVCGSPVSEAHFREPDRRRPSAAKSS